MLREVAATRPQWASLMRKMTLISLAPPQPLKRRCLNIVQCVQEFRFQDLSAVNPHLLECVAAGQDVGRIGLSGRTPLEGTGK